jgi:hypothetical protein
MRKRTFRGDVVIFMTILILVTSLLIGIAIGAKNAAQRSAKTTVADATQTVLRAACPTSQITRAWQRVRAEVAPSERTPEVYIADARSYFGIIDCGATYDGRVHGVIFLPNWLDDCFVRLTDLGYWRDHPATTDPAQLSDLCR